MTIQDLVQEAKRNGYLTMQQHQRILQLIDQDGLTEQDMDVLEGLLAGVTSGDIDLVPQVEWSASTDS